MAGQQENSTVNVDLGSLVVPMEDAKPKGRQPVRDRTIASMADEPAGDEGQPDNRRAAPESDASAQKLKALTDEKTKLEERLSELNSKVEKYSPFTNMLESDPKFVRHMAGYLDGTTQEQQQSATLDPKRFGLEDLDDFDLKEALSSPSSPSAKLFSTVVAQTAAQVADSRLGEVEKRRAASDAAVADKFEREQFLRSNKDVTEEELNKAVDFVKKTPLSYNHVVSLFRASNGDLTKRAREEVLSQMRKAGNIPMTLATRGDAGGNGKDDNDTMVDNFIKKLKQSNNPFTIK